MASPRLPFLATKSLFQDFQVRGSGYGTTAENLEIHLKIPETLRDTECQAQGVAQPQVFDHALTMANGVQLAQVICFRSRNA